MGAWVWEGLCWAREGGAALVFLPSFLRPWQTSLISPGVWLLSKAPGSPWWSVGVGFSAPAALHREWTEPQGPGWPQQDPEPGVGGAAGLGGGQPLTLLLPTAGCRCDVGGALGQGCDPRTGACRCRPNTQGLTCSEWVPPLPGPGARGLARQLTCWRRCGLPLTTPALARPARDHYVPDPHDLRLELEEAATPDGHTVRFGFNPLEFESFSWRGYAQMTPIQVGEGLPLPDVGFTPPPRPRGWWGGGLGMAREGPP